MSFTVCSLFSGIGGIDLGFKQAGFNIIWANEIDKSAAETYRYNLGSDTLIEKDIKKIDPSQIPNFDVLVAGFPCQPFSIAGKQRGFSDPRGELFFQISKIVEAKKPRVIFLENVANLLDHNEGKSFLTVYNALVPYGYTFKYQVMDSYEYGNIPQHRTRIFIVAFLENKKCENFKFPEKVKNTTKLNDIINRSQQHSSCYYYNENNKYFSELDMIVRNKQALYKIKDYGVVNKPYFVCPTLVASMGAFKHRIPVLRDDFGIRMLTPYECLALLGFPKSFRFPKITLDNAYKQCGNSVAVPVIRRIAENIKRVMIE